MLRAPIHRLQHLPGLAVSAELISARFRLGCLTSNCRARCCESGVFVDQAERDRILEHAALIQRHMDRSQARDPARWFEATGRPDSDFPTRMSFGTEVHNGACVFLAPTGRCTLQRADEREAGGVLGLKPFFCSIFPLTIVDGVLDLDQIDGQVPAECCRPDDAGELTVFDLCRAELIQVLGEPGVEALRQVARQSASRR